MNKNAVVQSIRHALREMGCVHLFTSEGEQLIADIPFTLKFSPDGEGYVIEIMRTDLPPTWGYARLKRKLNEFEKSIGNAPFGIYFFGDTITITDPITESAITGIPTKPLPLAA